MQSRIAKVGELLRSHLLQAFTLPAWSGLPPQISASPSDTILDAATAGTLCVWLYHVAADASARNEVPVGGRRFGTSVERALAVDLHYLVTAHAVDAALAQALLEHAAMRLLKEPMVPEPEPVPLAALSFVPVSSSVPELIAILQALGQPLQPALAYRARAILHPHNSASAPLPVDERNP